MGKILIDEEPIKAAFPIYHSGQYAVYVTELGELKVSECDEEFVDYGALADEKEMDNLDSLSEEDRKGILEWVSTQFPDRNSLMQEWGRYLQLGSIH